MHENLPVIEVANRLLLDTLLSAPHSASLILTRLDERVAIIAVGQFDALLTRLGNSWYREQATVGEEERALLGLLRKFPIING